MSASATPGGSEREPIVSRRTRKSSGAGVWGDRRSGAGVRYG
jgi:hypothetical protein